MKTTRSLLILLSIAKIATAQTVGIGTGIPAPKAILDVYSNNKGFLPPRLVEDSISAMGSVSPGMVVYNTTKNCLMIYNGSTWKCLSSSTSGNGYELESASYFAFTDSSLKSEATAITSFSNGDYCVAGTFSGVKLDLGDGRVLTAPQLGANTVHGYVARYSATGHCVWALKLLAVRATAEIVPLSIHAAPSGSVFITGRFNDTMQLYHATGTPFNKLANDVAGDDDIFIIKINILGSVDWRRREGNGGGADIGNSIKVMSDKVYVGGQFHGNQNFGFTTQLNLVSYGGLDGFYAQYDTATGSVCTAGLHVGGVNDDVVQDLLVDFGSVYLTGSYETSYTAFPPIPAVGGKDMFVAKYLIGSPNAMWVECARGNGYEGGTSLKEYNGTLYVAGIFASNNSSFTNGAPTLQNTGGMDAFVIKLNAATGVYNAAGPSFHWVRHVGGNENDYITGLAIATNGICTVAGYFSNYLKFHNSYSIFATGGRDGFVASYLAQTGDLFKVAKAGSFYDDACNAISIHTNNDVGVAGLCGQVVTLNGMSSGKPNSANSQALVWLLK
ncbi:MAG: hypothetical protein V4722_21090 [Bacteroidota bacterium]